MLVAEDNPTNRKIIAQVLEHGGFEVTLATTGTQAVEMLQGDEFDVVILDKYMPGMSGMEVAEQYITMRGEATAPMIMLTAEATAEAMQQCKAAGMQAFLTKPIDPEMLFETIGALTGAARTYGDSPAPAALTAPTAAAEVLDEAVLDELDRHAYSPQFVADIVESFTSDMLDLIQRLESVVREENWNELPDLRHAIEGTASSSGARGITAVVGELKTLPLMTPEARDASIEALRQCFAATQDAMRNFLVRRSSRVPAGGIRIA